MVATGLGVGLIPLAPGTFGTLLGIPLAWGLQQVPHVGVRVLVIAVVCAVGVPICTLAARRLGGQKDPGSIVLDEIASLPITFFLIPLDSVAVVAAGFILHRLFDITKPPPARQLERLPSGLGIMADDWIAGVYSNLALRLVLWSGLLDRL
ncbi:MAG TPA: phosphatidylglycerophosphatase A [Pirellulales bacterium]|nr:phosphatidylglycerophosphatase A [Pirellulales bacterium]